MKVDSAPTVASRVFALQRNSSLLLIKNLYGGEGKKQRKICANCISDLFQSQQTFNCAMNSKVSLAFVVAVMETRWSGLARSGCWGLRMLWREGRGGGVDEKIS